MQRDFHHGLLSQPSPIALFACRGRRRYGSPGTSTHDPTTLGWRRGDDVWSRTCTDVHQRPYHAPVGMLARLRTATVIGIEASLVDVEVDVSFGLPSFTMVGLPDVAIRESRDRVRAAILNSGFEFPRHRITVNLAPADLHKTGTPSICRSLSASWRPTATPPAVTTTTCCCSENCRSTGRSSRPPACCRWP